MDDDIVCTDDSGGRPQRGFGMQMLSPDSGEQKNFRVGTGRSSAQNGLGKERFKFR